MAPARIEHRRPGPSTRESVDAVDYALSSVVAIQADDTVDFAAIDAQAHTDTTTRVEAFKA